MTATFTEETYGTVKKIGIAWTTASSSGGTTTGTTTNAFSGAIKRLVTVPDTSTSVAANYDIVLNDQDSTDTLMGAGANRHSANTEQVNAASLGIVANDKLTFTVTNASSSAGGACYVYIR